MHLTYIYLINQLVNQDSLAIMKEEDFVQVVTEIEAALEEIEMIEGIENTKNIVANAAEAEATKEREKEEAHHIVADDLISIG